jgi:class 3 adenylate cyclase/tetratricopeptide (TPR) repeat protein/predicted Ser/Thr protein kinase
VARTDGTDALLGKELAGYRVESRVGRGGMGVVYLARDARLGRPVALKVLRTELAADARFRERFLRESRIAASIDHPHVVPVYEAGEAEDALFIAMRYVEGPDLGALLDRQGALDPSVALDLVGQAAKALDAAHRQGLVHRDVKPANILVGDDQHAYLTDFGLSRLAGASSHTGGGHFLGTVAYAAPEQIEGGKQGPPADVYALGAVLVECLTGTTPYPRDSDLAVLWAHMSEDPPSVSARRPELPVALDAVVSRALAKEPEARFASCGELVAATRQALVEGRPPAHARRQAGAVRKTVTILFADLAASSRAPAPLDPESLARVRARCLSEVETVLQRHGATTERLSGHGVLGVFGVPVVREDDALRAVGAAAELRERVAEISLELEQTTALAVAARVGIDTGEVVASGPDAGPADLEGETMTLAAKLEGSARASEILLGPGTHVLLADFVVAEKLEPDRRDSSAPAWRLITLLPRRPALSGDSTTRMVGRERELDELQRSFAAATETRSCRLVTVLGPAGIGKSRLASALASSLEDRATVLAGRCLSYGEGITYWPIGEMVRALAAGGDPLTMLQRLLGPADEGQVAADLVAAAVGLAGTPGTGDETFWAVRRLFEALARSRPLVVVLEDVHWAEATLLDLLEHVVRQTRAASLLVVCLARPELLDARPELRELPRATTLELHPLTKSESTLLLEQLRAGAGLPPVLAGRISDVAEGNPLFLEQLLAMASEETSGVSRLTLPPAIHALLAARLDRLPPDERHVIECAAIEGLVFHVGPLSELCQGIEGGTLWRHLLALTRKELVRPERSEVPGDEAMRFQHGLIREAAYQGIAKEWRAELHEQFGTFLERTHEHAQTALELEEIIGYHLEQAVRSRREAGIVRASDLALAEQASARLAAAGRRALARIDLPAAINLLERAATLLPVDGTERALLEVDRGAALADAGRLEEADALLAGVEGRMAGDRRVIANAGVERLFVLYSLDLEGVLAALRGRGGDLGRILEEEGDDRGLARLWLLRGLGLWAEGHVADAEAAWERAAASAERAGDRLAHADLLGWLASAAFFGPVRVDDGIARCTTIVEQLQDLRSMWAQALHFLAGLHAMAGRFDRADALLADASGTLGNLSVTVQWAVSHTEVLVALLKGDLQHAEVLLRGGRAWLEETGERNLLPMTVALLARVLYEQDRLDEAFACTEETRELAVEQDVVVQAIWQGVQARILARRGAAEEAEKLARAAVDLADGTDFVGFAGDALMDLADVLDRTGRPQAAHEALLRAFARYEGKGNEVAATRARALLDTADRR